MSERKLQIQVGLLFILSIALLVFGVLWFKEFTVGEAYYPLRVGFPNTSGLVKGDAVEVSGVPSGKVDDITFENQRALVTLKIVREVALYPGTRVAIRNVGIMGQKVVAIDPGPAEGDPLVPGTILRGTYESGLPQLMGDLSGTLDAVERLATRLDTVLAEFGDTDFERVRRTLDHAERMTGELAGVLEENRDDLKEAVDNLSAGAREMRAALDGRGEQVGEILDAAGGTATRLDSTLVRLDDSMGRVDRILGELEAGEGTAGKLLSDEALYERLVTAVAEAESLMADLRANPRRYFKVSLF
jgi:phospholipid/cholesterol/gamma-HCH transport system substrate-binding protein